MPLSLRISPVLLIRGPYPLPTCFLPESSASSRSFCVALLVFTLLKADALLFFFLMASISSLKNLYDKKATQKN